MTIAILNALGADDESGALRLVAETNEFLEDLRSITGKASFAEMITATREACAVARDVISSTGKPASEAIGVVLAWKQSHEARPELEGRVAALEEQNRSTKVAALIKQGREDGKLTPKMAEEFAKWPLAQLESYLAVAARVLPSEVKQPAANSASAEILAAADAEGRKYEDIKPSERAAMKKSNPDLFHALRGDWVRRGSPSRPSVAA